MKIRIALGLLATIALHALLSQFAPALLPGAGSSIGVATLVQSSALQSAIISFIAVAVGAFVARCRFLLPAIFLWLATWLVVIYTLTAISAGQSSYWEIARFNWLAISASLLSTIIGAKLGEFLGAKSGRAGSAAAT